MGAIRGLCEGPRDKLHRLATGATELRCPSPLYVLPLYLHGQTKGDAKTRGKKKNRELNHTSLLLCREAKNFTEKLGGHSPPFAEN